MAAIGFGTLIMDDGWQTADTGRDYPYCGDWEPEPSKFPDMPANVERVHELGLSCVLWLTPRNGGDAEQAMLEVPVAARGFRHADFRAYRQGGGRGRTGARQRPPLPGAPARKEDGAANAYDHHPHQGESKAPRAIAPAQRHLEVARMAGVSRQTVSNVINGNSGFNEATRKRVAEAIKALSYRPDRAARSVRNSPTTSQKDLGPPNHPFVIGFLQALIRAADSLITTHSLSPCDRTRWSRSRG